MTKDLRPAWRILALTGLAWLLADHWLLAPAPALAWAGVRGDLWGLPVQGLILAAAALLIQRDKKTAALGLIPCLLLLVYFLSPAPGVDRTPMALVAYAASLGQGTAMTVFTGVAGLLLLLVTLAATAAALSGRLLRVAGVAMFRTAMGLTLVQLLLHGFDVIPVNATRLGWSFLASVMGFTMLWSAIPRLIAEGVPTRPGPWEGRILMALLPVGVLIAYVAVKLEAAGLSAGDENIYFYDVLLFTRGLMPYRDYFFAHPPLHVAIPGLLCMVTGFSLPLLKLLPLAASAGTGLLVWDTARRPFGQVAGAAAMVAFLFALEQLQASSNLTGVNLTVLFMALSLNCTLRGRFLLGGLFGGAAVSTGVYAAPILAAVPLVLAFTDSRGLLRFLAGGLGVALLVNLGFRALGGPGYWDQVYLFHTLKPVKEAQTAAGWLVLRTSDWLLLVALWTTAVTAGVLRRPLAARLGHLGLTRGAWLAIAAAASALLALVLYRSAQAGDPAGPARVLKDMGVLLDGKEFLRTTYYHAGLLLAGLLLPLAWLGTRTAKLPAAAAPGAWAPPAIFTLLFLGSLAELSVLRETYSFYYLVLLLPAALAAGAIAGLAWAGLVHVTRGTGRRNAALAAGMVGLLWAAGLGPVVALDAGHERFPEESKAAGQWSCYPWKDSFPDNPFGEAVRARAWRHCRVKGALEAPVPRYLWNKKHHFTKAHEIGEYIAEHTEAGETIAGASMTTPLLAIFSGRDVAAQFVDTNRKRFSAGLVTEEEFWDQVCQTPVRYIVTSPGSMFTPRRMSRHPVIRRYFKPEKRFKIPALKFSGRYSLVLFRRVADEPDDQGYYCRWPEQGKQQ